MVARRPRYADGQDVAVGIAQSRPTAAVGIDLAVGVGPVSGSVVLDVFRACLFSYPLIVEFDLFLGSNGKNLLIIS